MNERDIAALIAAGESLAAEFKSDRSREPLHDGTIYEEMVALANTDGGCLLVGVEDDGTVTGAKPRHGNATDPLRLQAAVFHNTVPHLTTHVSVVQVADRVVLCVQVGRHRAICATAAGKCVRRVIGGDGKPATVPYYPADHPSRARDLGGADLSSEVLEGGDWSCLDPLEFERLRRTVSRQPRSDKVLLDLQSDEELAKALGLVVTRGTQLAPTYAGALLVGREELLRDAVATHEVRFQVIDGQGDVRTNDVLRGPLLSVVEELDARFQARNQEREVLVGMWRFAVPDYSPQGFREAILNALLHRSYSELQPVHVQWHPDHLLIASPGGFPEGVTIDNILTHEPKPRNRQLARVFERVGLAEQSARGVDRIYMGQLRYGRPAPDYGRSDGTAVRLVLHGGAASLDFARFVYEQDKGGQQLSVDDMLVLNALLHERRVDAPHVSRLIQKGAPDARRVLERLVEGGLVEAVGERQGRAYHLSAQTYRRLGRPGAYVRVHGIDSARQEALVLEFVKAHGRVARREVADLCGLTGPQATHLLRALCMKHRQFRQEGRKRGTHYVWSEDQDLE